MKVQELRLGNYLFIGGIERYVKVSAIFLSHFKCTDENGIDFNNHQNNIKPIELTEEILLKCGFKKLGSIFCITERCVVDASEKRISFYIDGIEEDIDLDLPKHLHQLQNLYWCLCGKELDVNI